MQNIPHDLTFISCPNTPCGVSTCSRTTPHYHCRFCGYGTSQAGNAISHSRICPGLDIPQKDYNLQGNTDGMYSLSSQQYPYYPQTQQSTANSKITQQSAMFNFVVTPQNTQFGSLYGPQTVFPNPNLFSPSNFNNFAQLDSTWMTQSRLISANAPSVNNSTSDGTSQSSSPGNCCRIDSTPLGVASPLLMDTCKVVAKDIQTNWNACSQTVQTTTQQKYPDSTASSCSISLLFLEQNKESEECINVDDICLTPKSKTSKQSNLEDASLSSSTESDIVVEDSDSDVSDAAEENQAECVVCCTKPTINRFTKLTEKTPLTSTSKTSVYDKLTNILENNDCSKSSICSRCLGMINGIDALEVKLKLAVQEFKSIYKSGKENIIEPVDESLMCHVCDKTFSSAAYLSKHQQYHSQTFSYCCEYCGKGFITLQKLEQHVMLHSNTFKYQCEMCGKQFVEKSSLNYHIRKHNSDSKYTCSVCSKGFVHKNVFKVHLKSHGNDFFVCQHCGRKIKTYSNLQVHLRICSGNMKHVCHKCDKKFPIKSLLEKHDSVEHKNKYRFLCNHCNKGFWKESDLKSHTKTHETEKPYKCTTCGNKYKSKKNLTHHMRLHEGPQLKCAICCKQFTRADALTDHMNGHSGRKPYECQTCWKRFANRINFNVHVKKHSVDKKGSKCLVCKKMILGNMAEHLQIHADRKSFTCKQCPSVFSFKNSLLKHVKAKHVSEES